MPRLWTMEVAGRCESRKDMEELELWMSNNSKSQYRMLDTELWSSAVWFRLGASKEAECF